MAEVVRVERNTFHGWVYNLDTGEGWYEAESIVSANCRCTLVYVENPDDVVPGYETPQMAPEEEAPPPADLPALQLRDITGNSELRRKYTDEIMGNIGSGQGEWNADDADLAAYHIEGVGGRRVAVALDKNQKIAAAIGHEIPRDTPDVLEVGIGARSGPEMVAALKNFMAGEWRSGLSIHIYTEPSQTVALEEAFGVRAAGDGVIELPQSEFKRIAEEARNPELARLAPSAPTAHPYEAHIGITPFRAGEDNVIGFYDSSKYQTFLNDMRVAADHYHVSIDKIERVDGLWQGQAEPSVRLYAHDHETGVQALAADLGKGYNQDGVLLFDPLVGKAEGPVDIAVTFDQYADRERIYAALGMQGIDGGTILPDGRLHVIGSGSDFLERAQKVASLLGVDYEAEVGRMTLIERGDYDRFIEKASQQTVSPMTNDPALSLLPGDHRINLSTSGERIGEGNVNLVYKTSLDGETFVVKPEAEYPEQMRNNIEPGNDTGRERAAYVMSRWFNVLDPDYAVNTPLYRVSTVKNADGESVKAGLSRFIPDSQTAAAYGRWGDYSAWMEVMGSDGIRRGAIFDYVIGNTDRHLGNLMFEKTGEGYKPWLIDHGLSFPEFNDDVYNARIEEAYMDKLPNYGEFTDEDVAFLEKLQAAWPQIEQDLSSLLDPASLKAAKERIDLGIEQRTIRPEWPGDRY